MRSRSDVHLPSLWPVALWSPWDVASPCSRIRTSPSCRQAHLAVPAPHTSRKRQYSWDYASSAHLLTDSEKIFVGSLPRQRPHPYCQLACSHREERQGLVSTAIRRTKSNSLDWTVNATQEDMAHPKTYASPDRKQVTTYRFTYESNHHAPCFARFAGRAAASPRPKHGSRDVRHQFYEQRCVLIWKKMGISVLRLRPQSS